MSDHDTPVSEELASAVRRSLKSELGQQIRAIRTEIQDGGLFLFVEAEIGETATSEGARNVCKMGGAVISRLVPSREDEYSWIFNVTKNSAIVSSESGGWIQRT